MPREAKLTTTPPRLRGGARHLEVYNSGHLVHLYDDGARAALRGDDTVLPRVHARIDAADNAYKERKPTPPDESHLLGRLVAYELQQDDPLDIDLMVGDPLTSDEIAACAGLALKAPQRSVLELPTGKLCLDSNDTLRIDPADDPSEPGATVDVPPGRYVVSVYRVDWDEMKEKDKTAYGDAGWGEIVVLTPLAGDAPSDAAAVLPYPLELPRTDWAGRYEVKKNALTGLGRIRPNAGMLDLNLDDTGIAALALVPGSLLDVQLGAHEAVVAFVGPHLRPRSYKLSFDHFDIFGAERSMTPLDRWDNAYLATLAKDPETGIALLEARPVKCGRPYEGREGKWLTAKATVLDEKLTLKDAELLGHWQRIDDAIEGRVLLHARRWIGLNLDRGAIDVLGAEPGSLLAVTIGSETQHARLFEHLPALVDWRRKRDDQISEQLSPLWDRAYEAKWADDQAALAAAAADIRRLWTPDEQLAAYLEPHWFFPDREVLVLVPLAPDMPFTDPLTVGFASAGLESAATVHRA